jgi:hypothetical protein
MGTLCASPEITLFCPFRKRHGLVDAGQLPARYGQVPGAGGPGADHHGIEIGGQFISGDIHPGLNAGLKTMPS